MKYLLNFATLLASITLFAVPENKQGIQLLLENAEKYLDTNRDSCLYYLDLAENGSVKLKYPKGQARSKFLNARLFSFERNHYKADKLLKEALDIYVYLKDTIGISDVYNMQGTSLRKQDKFDEAIEMLKLAKNISIKFGYRKGIANADTNIGIVYDYKGDFEKALKFYFKGLNIYQEANYKKGMASSYLNIGLVHYFMKSYEEAINYNFKAKEQAIIANDKRLETRTYLNISAAYKQINQIDSSIISLDKGIEMAKELKWFVMLSKFYAGKADIERRKGNTKKAIEIYKDQLKSLDSLNAPKEDVVLNYMVLANIYKKEELFKPALEYAKKGKEIAQNYSLKYQELGMLEQEIDIYGASGNYKKALELCSEYIVKNDSIFNETKIKQIAELEIKYESEKKDKQLAIEQAELIEIQCLLEEESKAKRQQLIILLSLLSVAGLGLFIFSLISRNRKLLYQVLENEKIYLEEASTNLYKKNEALHIKNEQLKKSEQLILKQNLKLNQENAKLEESISIKNRVNPVLKDLVNIKGYKIDRNLILYACRDDDKTNNALILLEDDETISVRITNKELLTILPNDVFMQANRSIIVNLLQVKHLKNKKLVMANNDKIEISENNFKQIKSKRELLIK